MSSFPPVRVVVIGAVYSVNSGCVSATLRWWVHGPVSSALHAVSSVPMVVPLGAVAFRRSLVAVVTVVVSLPSSPVVWVGVFSYTDLTKDVDDVSSCGIPSAGAGSTSTVHVALGFAAVGVAAVASSVAVSSAVGSTLYGSVCVLWMRWSWYRVVSMRGLSAARVSASSYGTMSPPGDMRPAPMAAASVGVFTTVANSVEVWCGCACVRLYSVDVDLCDAAAGASV